MIALAPRSTAAALAMTLSAVLWCTPARAAAPDPLEDGIAALRSFEDSKAHRIFEALLAQQPQAGDEARIHLYLGLIAVNRFEPDTARAEFRRALAIAPTTTLPKETSPRARRLFAEVRKTAAIPDPVGGSAAAASTPLSAAVPALPLAPPEADNSAGTHPVPAAAMELASPRRSHAPAYVLGGVAVASLAAGIVCAVLSKGALNAASGAPAVAQAQADLNRSGTLGLSADILFGAALTAAGVGTGVFVAEGL